MEDNKTKVYCNICNKKISLRDGKLYRHYEVIKKGNIYFDQVCPGSFTENFSLEKHHFELNPDVVHKLTADYFRKETQREFEEYRKKSTNK